MISDTEFVNILWEEQKRYIEELNSNRYFSRFKSFQGVFDCFEKGQTVAQIACGSIVNDLYLTMDRVGKEGRIILIDENPEFIYSRALQIVGEQNLPKGKSFYVESEEGKKYLQELFAKVNIEAYVQRLSPYPTQIRDESLDHVMAINAAFELMAYNPKREPPNVEGLVVETYKKLKRNGSFIVQGLMSDDIYGFSARMYEIAKKNGLNLERDRDWEYDYEEKIWDAHYAGYWARWIKG